MKLLLVFIIFFTLTKSFSQSIKISLFNGQTVKTSVISTVSGSFILKDKQQVIDRFEEPVILYISLIGNQLYVKGIGKPYGFFDKLVLEPSSDTCIFSVKPVSPSLSGREYRGNLYLSVDYNRILMINELDLDEYLAGVVEAEGGPNATSEYYKAQAILCRTYALKNLKRHIEEEFNLCDEVHCQAYKGRCRINESILYSCKITNGLVAVHSDTSLITAAFHANCGGETQDANNIWLISKPYLVSVKDPYCLNKHGANWGKNLPVSEWKDYLVKKGFDLVNLTSIKNFSREVVHRTNFYKINNDSILFNKLRTDWKLKSSFFSVIQKENVITLKGKGYGHGVGMCQEGAMEMSTRGFSFKQIIDFYYKDVQIINYKAEHVF
ncbi:MAG: SpoIID/LytB domain-containing protein [bacterium]